MKLNLNALEQAIASLEEALEFAQSEMAQRDKRLFRQFRNSVIQCFEFTYEVSYKMLERRLSLELPVPIDNSKIGFNDLLREAAQYGLINEPKNWIEYRRARNITSHVYNEKYAQEVYVVGSGFLIDAKKLLKTLQEKNI